MPWVSGMKEEKIHGNNFLNTNYLEYKIFEAENSKISTWFLDILHHSISRQWKVVYYGQFHASLLLCFLSMKPHQHLLLFVKLLPIHQSHALISSSVGSIAQFCRRYLSVPHVFLLKIKLVRKKIKKCWVCKQNTILTRFRVNSVSKNRVTSLPNTHAAQQSRSNKKITIQNW